MLFHTFDAKLKSSTRVRVPASVVIAVIPFQYDPMLALIIDYTLHMADKGCL
jgi:hypothetical protein